MRLRTGKTTDWVRPFEPYVQTFCGIGPVDPTVQAGEAPHPDNGFAALHAALTAPPAAGVDSDGNAAQVLHVEVWPQGATQPDSAVLLALRVQGPGARAHDTVGAVLSSLGLPVDCTWTGQDGERVRVASLAVRELADMCMAAGCERIVLKQA